MDSRGWWAAVRGVPKSRKELDMTEQLKLSFFSNFNFSTSIDFSSSLPFSVRPQSRLRKVDSKHTIR